MDPTYRKVVTLLIESCVQDWSVAQSQWLHFWLSLYADVICTLSICLRANCQFDITLRLRTVHLATQFHISCCLSDLPGCKWSPHDPNHSPLFLLCPTHTRPPLYSGNLATSLPFLVVSVNMGHRRHSFVPSCNIGGGHGEMIFTTWTTL